MKITVSFTVDADLDGWAQATDTSAIVALTEVQTYLRSLNPIAGQTFLSLADPLVAVVDLNRQ